MRPNLSTILARAGTAAAVAGIAALGFPGAAHADGGNSVTNGSFEQPGVDGANPTGWTMVNLDSETAPFASSIATYDSCPGSPPKCFPPPQPVPDGTFASEAFYQAGSHLGSEGIGGSQQLTAPSPSSEGRKLSFSTVETNSPDTSLVTWAGSILELDLASGAQTYKLRYFAPYTPKPGETYSGLPATSGSTGYVILRPLTFKQWTTFSGLDPVADAKQQLGLGSFTVTGVVYGVLENTTNAGGPPYPNETSYFDAISLGAPTPPPAVPEVPVTAALPLSALVAGGAAVAARRRHRTA